MSDQVSDLTDQVPKTWRNCLYDLVFRGSMALVLLSAFMAQQANAAISLDSTTTAVSSVNVNNLSWTHTVGAGANRILIVGISYRDGNVSSTSVTYGGVALILIGAQNAGGNQNRTELWYLLAPSSGTANVAVLMSASKKIDAASVSFTGVSQTTPLGTFSTATAQSTAASVNVSSAPGAVVIDTVTANGDANSLAVNASQTQLWNTFSGNGDAGNARSGGSTKPGASTTTMSWTLGASKPWSMVAVSINPGPSSPNFTILKMVQVASDPVNGGINPKSIPGAYVLYSILITNQGAGTGDTNSIVITDTIPANTAMFVGDLGAVGSGPIQFIDGSPTSGLTYTFSGLSNTSDDVAFSNNGGTTFAYVPIPDVNGFDANVSAIRVNPKGLFNGAGSGNPSFQITFRVRIM